ncbi:MAG: DUF3084 domain-containing protein [Pegethrix bostrychoides GSE-TBD4-15B]|jgi:uncharacterized protein (DUF3084 family)|uniref:DUF3084 domain-containing protein n=1 Tax=Pegethrix bostrychoides GSE-TBD4-15B TaxID=2839662 RepID=A0A951U8A3_9CYAN|nr:DUF3084 domain-containing protein [Pegethrix bostrychoides GSE-TBD4-15B]
MTTGLVLIVAALVLGGVIATVGDRLGTRVGKARLSLFNLRPRQTATLITIMTGIVISASTFGLLFAVSDQLRTGVFELNRIQDNLEEARSELRETAAKKEQVETRLQSARKQQNTAQRRLEQTNRSLREAVTEQAQTQAQLKSTEQRLNASQTQFQQAQQLLASVSGQAARLRSEIQALQSDRQTLIQQRNEVRGQIAQRDQEIAQRDLAIRNREAQLKDLETQIAFLDQQKVSLEREYEDLRRGNVTLFRNQTLAWGVLRVERPDAAPQAISQLLQRANQLVAQIIKPGTSRSDQQVIRITTSQVEQLASQITSGQDYVVRVMSAGNYVVGEPCVLAGEACVDVVATAAPNEVVFQQGEVVAATTVNPSVMQEEKLNERILLLIAAAQFRCRQAGILDDTVTIAGNQRQVILDFIAQVQQSANSLEVKAVAAEDAYIAGAQLKLVAIQNDQLLFGTR